MKGPVITSMDESGHLVLPEEVRREAGLEPGMPLEVSSREGRVEVRLVAEAEGETAPQQVRIVPKGRLWVVEPVEPGEPLTAEVVRQTQDWIRDRGFDPVVEKIEPRWGLIVCNWRVEDWPPAPLELVGRRGRRRSQV